MLGEWGVPAVRGWLTTGGELATILFQHPSCKQLTPEVERKMSIKDVLKDAEERMKSTLAVLEEDLKARRTGRASGALVEKLLVDYYGVATPLFQLASISVPEPQVIAIRPYDKSTLKSIERAIQASELGLT